jgi:hypothetical protein
VSRLDAIPCEVVATGTYDLVLLAYHEPFNVDEPNSWKYGFRQYVNSAIRVLGIEVILVCLTDAWGNETLTSFFKANHILYGCKLDEMSAALPAILGDISKRKKLSP